MRRLGIPKNQTRVKDKENDFYSTDPQAVFDLLRYEKFQHHITEPSCGNGNIAEVLKHEGYQVDAFDIADRGYGYQKDFFSCKDELEGDVIMNPPYAFAKEHIVHALQYMKDGSKLCALLKIQFLESLKRRDLFEKYPLTRMYVFRRRANVYQNDNRSLGISNVCYCWFVWVKGYKGEPTIRWID